MSNPLRCRWGIIGAAVIARKFWQSVRWSENARLVGVASRRRERAAAFCDACQSRFAHQEQPLAFDSYEAMLDSTDIDAVYIPLPTGVREQWVVAAAARGKHVLCEKPCAVSAASMGRMLDACERAGVQFMDNVMFMHSARLEKLKQLLSDREKIGQLKRISSQFSFCADPSFFEGNIRMQMATEPWGCLGDLGWYNIRITLLAMNGQMPVRVRGNNLDGNWERPPIEFSGDLLFANGVTASLYCSFVNGNQQWVHFSGTRGYALIDDFTLPWFGNSSAIHYNSPQFNRSGFDFNYERYENRILTDEYSNAHPSGQEVNLVRNFSQLVLDGRVDSYWPTIALKTQRVMDALMKSARENAEIVF
jgi:predicted dehydrogenase